LAHILPRRVPYKARFSRSNWIVIMTKHVAVLMGGLSVERDVSLRSGEACAKAL
jgi:hypothetical protein